MTLLFFDFGTGEILVIVLVLFVVLGPKKLPEVARAVGKTINEIKRASAGFKNEINREIDRIEHDTKINDQLIDSEKAQSETKQPAVDETVAQGSMQEASEGEFKNNSINPNK